MTKRPRRARRPADDPNRSIRPWSLFDGPRPGAAPVADGPWTKDDVVERLVDGVKALHRSAGRVGPKEFGSVMPEVLVEWEDMLARAGNDDAKEKNRIRLAVTPRQMRLAEEAMAWPRQYVDEQKHRVALMTWLASKALRISFTKLLRARGMPKSTAELHRDRALAHIVVGLMRAGIDPRPFK